MFLTIRLPSDNERKEIKTQREQKKVARIDWTKGSLLGCCIERYGKRRGTFVCIRCLSIFEWRNTYYEIGKEEDLEYELYQLVKD